MLCTATQETPKGRRIRKSSRSFIPTTSQHVPIKSTWMSPFLPNPTLSSSQSELWFSGLLCFLPVPMAISNFDSNHRTACLLGLFGLLMLVQRGGAFQFKVGGNGNWSVPPDPNAKWYNQWAENNRFQIGDTLMFVYPSDKDTVLEVTEADFANCNTAHPIATYTDGHTVVQFNHSGPYYFISGVKENCQKNEKIVVIVMADRSKLTNGTGSASPPSPEMAAPSPAPSGEESPSPPPQITGEGNPSPAPVAEQAPPPPNGASPLTLSFVGSVGALLGWSLLLVS